VVYLAFSRYNYNGVIQKGKRPSKKFLKLQGKTVYDKDSTNFRKSVWKKKMLKSNKYHDSIIIYVMSKCDENECDGNLEYDIRGFKFCNKCGLGIKHDMYIDNRYKYAASINKRGKGFVMYNTRKTDETVNFRNIMWDRMDISEFLYFSDKGASKIIERMENIKRWESDKNAK